MSSRCKACIAPKLRGAQNNGSKTPRGAERRFHNSAGQILKVILPPGVMEPLFCAPQGFGPFVLHPAEFWSNATLTPQTHGDIVSGAQITTFLLSKSIYSYFVKVLFVSNHQFRNPYNQHDNLLRKNILQDGTFKVEKEV